MPTYPTLPTAKGSHRVPRDGRKDLIMGDGAGRVAKEHADKSDFKLLHVLDASQVSTFLSFYNSNSTATFDYVFPEDGLTYSVRFGKDAYETEWLGPGKREFRVRLIGA
jgi:hypothetical protein